MRDSRLSVGLDEQISAFLAGDRAAGEVLARRASRLALQTAGAVLRDREDAGDVAQEVVVEALRSLRALRDPEAFDAWVHKITVRVTSRALAKRARRTAAQLSLDDAPDGWDARDADADLDYVLSARAGLVAALARLPVRQRLALTLRYVHDLSDQEIGAALGCRTGTVHALLSRGRQALRTDPSLGLLVSTTRDAVV
jgi:RNA polymerase sigma-70 factor (ECF subfamily)